MKSMKGPFATVSINKQNAANFGGPYVDTYSGQITATQRGKPLGAIGVGGRVSNVWLSCLASGKDDGNTLSIAADVKINGTTCLTTQPAIAHVSGEASQQKTTKITGDTGITQASMSSSNTVTAGDVLTYDLVLTRTATPTTEISNVVIVVELEPEI
jgi:hypothetical protein